MFLQQCELFGDGGMSILVARDRVTEDRQSTKLIDNRAQSGVNHLHIFRSVAHGTSCRNVCRRQVSLLFTRSPS